MTREVRAQDRLTPLHHAQCVVALSTARLCHGPAARPSATTPRCDWRPAKRTSPTPRLGLHGTRGASEAGTARRTARRGARNTVGRGRRLTAGRRTVAHLAGRCRPLPPLLPPGQQAAGPSDGGSQRPSGPDGRPGEPPAPPPPPPPPADRPALSRSPPARPKHKQGSERCFYSFT